MRCDALERNPVRDVGRIDSEKSAARALTLDEAIDLRAKIHSNGLCRAWDLVDFTDFMLATGLRIDEVSAVTWDALNLEDSTVEVRGTVRITGSGLVIKASKSANGRRILALPGRIVAMLRRRKQERPHDHGTRSSPRRPVGSATRRTPSPTFAWRSTRPDTNG